MEEYKCIADFPNYEVSNLGNVRNKKTGRVLKPRLVKKLNNYTRYDVNLYNSLGGFNCKIHRLVATAFLPNPENKHSVDHIDRNPTNNNLSNLRWATRSENMFNSKTRTDNTLGEKNIYQTKGRRKFYYKKVGQKTRYFDTLEEAIVARDYYLNTN